MKTLTTASIVLAILNAVPAIAAPGWEARVQRISDDPAVGAWLGRQRNSIGGSCCYSADAHLYYGGYNIEPDGGITVPMPDGSVIHIPPEKVLPYNPNDKNPTGTSVWWYNFPDGLGTPSEATTYCFAPGALG